LAETYAKLRDECWEPRERSREQYRHGELASAINASEEAQEAFAAAWQAPIGPLPVRFADFTEYLVEIAIDPRQLGLRDGTAWLDVHRRLPELVADLRGDLVKPVELLRTERWESPPRTPLP
jgi:hypothetical protein